MKIAFILAASILASAATAADLPAPPAPDAAKEKKICRNLEPAIGSNLMRRSCKTRAEWAQEQAHASTGDKINVEKFRDMSTQFAAPH